MSAMFRLAQAAYPHLKASRGPLIATGSLAGKNASPTLGSYSASKAALAMLMAQFAPSWRTPSPNQPRRRSLRRLT